MKKIKNFIVISITFIAIIFSTNYCTEPHEKPDCEKYGTGNVRITNNAPFEIYVDVTEVQYGDNDIRHLYQNQSTDYTMSAGIIYCYAASQTNYDNNEWNEKIESCTQCRTFTFTWTTSSAKTIRTDNSYIQVYNENNNITNKKIKQ